jgi:hydroxymethylpyrimidine pyrophosphatase-like HAD family hydrolase
MNKYSIFLDLDGCVFSKYGGSMPAEDIVWFQKYIMAANVGQAPQIKICTGRNIPFVSAILYLLGRPIGSGFSIIENGSVLYFADAKQILINPQISPLALKQLALVRERIAPAIAKMNPDLLWVYPGNLVNTVFIRNRQSPLSLEGVKTIIRKAILKGLKLKAKMPAISIVSFGGDVAVIPRGINKGTAAGYLSQTEGIELKKCLGIGDGKSDVGFLNKMGIAGCPSNADQECIDFVRRKGGKVSLRPCISGVVDIIREYTQFDR